MRFVKSNYWTTFETNILNHRKLCDISFKNILEQRTKTLIASSYWVQGQSLSASKNDLGTEFFSILFCYKALCNLFIVANFARFCTS